MKINYFKLGREAFRVRDINKDSYSLACERFPDIITVRGGIQIFDHSKQKVDLYDKLKWAKGWKRSREDYIKRKFLTEKQLKRLFRHFFKQHGIKIDYDYTNDLYMRYTTGSKPKFNIKFK